MRRTDNNLNSLVVTLQKTTMLVIKRGHKRHFHVKRATALVVLTLFVSLVEPTVICQTKQAEEHLADIKKRIDDISRAPDPPDVVTLHGKKEWHCASAALRRTGDAIEWVGAEEGIKKTFAAALKAVADIASLGGATRAGLALDILNAYMESENLEQFTHELAKIALLKGFGKALEKTEKLDEKQSELIKTLSEKIWNALGGAKGPISVVKIYEDPLCGNIRIELRVTTEGVTEAPRPKPKPENLVQKSCEKGCTEARNKWSDERSAAMSLDREAKAQEENLAQARRDLDAARYLLAQAKTRLAKANADWEANKKSMVLGKREASRLEQQKAEADVSNQQRQVDRLPGEIDRLTRSAPEARASADKQSKAAKDAEDAYRMCLKKCYDKASNSPLPRDREQAQELLQKLLAGETPLYVPPTTPESPPKSSGKKFLHFEATGDCRCKFPPGVPDAERLGPFGVTGIAELIPQKPEAEGETIAINYKLGAMKFDVVATCGCKTPAKSETAIPTETRTQTQSAKPTSQPEQKTAHFYLPSGMERLNEVTAASFYSSPVAPPGAWCPCCACCWPYGQPNYASIGGVINVNVRLCLAMDKVGIGQAIHIAYDRQHYDAETYLQWNASGGPELKVDLEVQRPGSAAFEKLLAGSEAGDGFLFATKNPGTYVFRATAKDSSGRSSFNTLSLTFPVIESEAESIPR